MEPFRGVGTTQVVEFHTLAPKTAHRSPTTRVARRRPKNGAVVAENPVRVREGGFGCGHMGYEAGPSLIARMNRRRDVSVGRPFARLDQTCDVRVNHQRVGGGPMGLLEHALEDERC